MGNDDHAFFFFCPDVHDCFFFRGRTGKGCDTAVLLTILDGVLRFNRKTPVGDKAGF